MKRRLLFPFLIVLVLLGLIVSIPGLSITSSSFDKPPVYYDNRQIDLDNPFYQGNFGYRYPIDVPTGINGLEPTLALVYNSELTADKFLGVGWELVGFNSIRRNDRLGTPWYNDSKDTYILTLNGKEYVMSCQGQFEEQSSLLAQKNGESWIVYEGDGTQLVFTVGARNSQGIYSWFLSVQTDTNGNSMKYNYDTSLLAGDGVAYLKTITYDDANGVSQTIQFEYENKEGSEPIPSYWAGFAQVYNRCLVGITAGDRSYRFSYKSSRSTKRGLLSEIKNDSEPAIILSYDSDTLDDTRCWEFDEHWRLSFVKDYIGDWENESHYQEAHLLIRDFNNDGNADIYYQKHLEHYADLSFNIIADYLPEIYLGDGKGGWRLAHNFWGERSHLGDKYKHIGEDHINAGVSVYTNIRVRQSIHPRIFDYNRDGILDIVLTVDYYYDALETVFNPNPFSPVPYDDYTATPVIRWCESKSAVFINDGSGHFSHLTSYDELPSNIYEPGCNLDLFRGVNPPIMTNVNGDSMPDYFKSPYHYVNEGGGQFKPVQDGHKIRRFFDQRRVDLDGNGVAEIANYDKKTGTISFMSPKNIHNLTETTPMPQYDLVLDSDRRFCRPLYNEHPDYIYELFADLNHDGAPDMLTINGAYLNKTKPDLLTCISGEETINVSYTRISVASQQGDDAGRKGPAIYRWAVESIATDDGSSRFTYNGGLHDLLRREFRGFESIVVSDEDGTTTYTYDPTDRRKAGLVQSVTGPDGSINYTYNFTGADSWRLESLVTVSQLKDGPETTTTNIYDEDGNLIRQDNTLSVDGIQETRIQVYEYSKNPASHVVNTINQSMVKDNVGNVLQKNIYYYDEASNLGTVTKGNLTRIDSIVYPTETGSQDLTVRIGYDGRGVANAVMDAEGNTTTTELLKVNEKYRRRVTTNALGHQSYELIEAATGLTVESVDANGVKTLYTYYPDKRLKRVTRPDGGYTEYEYLKDDQGTTNITRTLVSNTEKTLLWHEERFNRKGQLIQTLDKEVRYTDADGAGPYDIVGRVVITEKTYDRWGQAATETLPRFVGEMPKKVQYHYETTSKRRLIKTTYPDGTYQEVQYDDPNRRVTVIDAKGNRTVTQERYERAFIKGHGNIVCRVTTTTDPLGFVRKAYYNLDGNLLQATDPNQKQTIYWYDSLGRVYKSMDPYKGTVQYVYGANGQLMKRTDAKGQIVNYQYDILNRLKAKRFADGRAITWTYDLKPSDNAIHTYGIGRLCAYTDKSGTTRLGYDAMGNLTQKVHGSQTLTMAYDLQDRVCRIAYPGGVTIDYAYDMLGLSRVKQGEKVLAEYTDRTAYGAAQNLSYANGIRSLTDYNPDNGRIRSIRTSGGQLLNLTYLYDPNGNVLSIQDSAPISSQRPTANSESFVYDAVNRLIGASGSYGTMSYSYDAVGNITSKENVAFTYGDPEHPYAPTEGSNGIKASYDANGNMVAKTDGYGNNFTLNYDEENQLTRIWKNNNYSEEYTYDATGYRVARNVGSIKTDYVYWGNTLLFETTGGKDIHYVWAEGKLIAKLESTGTTYFTHDHLGSSKLQTDEKGNVLSVDVTKPFGPRICDEILSETFATLEKVDTEASLMVHDPETGVIKAPATGIDRTSLLAVNTPRSVISQTYQTIKTINLRLTNQDTDRILTARFVATGKVRIRVVGQDNKQYLTKEITAGTHQTLTVTVNLTKAPNQLYRVLLDLACTSLSQPASNSLFEVTWGNLGESFGEFYSQPYDLQEEVRSLRLSWAGVGVALMVSTDNKLWETVENGKVTLLKNPGRRIWVKGLLKVDPNTVLDGYQLEVNPAKYSLFTGKTLEESTGLVYFGRRWYDPEFGRFITVDPLGDGGNWYAYCGNNPVNAVDPDGHKAFIIANEINIYGKHFRYYGLFVSTRGSDLLEIGGGLLPGYGLMTMGWDKFVMGLSDIPNNDPNGFVTRLEAIKESDVTTVLLEILPEMNRLGKVKDLPKYLRVGGKLIGELASWVDTAFTIGDVINYVSNKDYINEQLVQNHFSHWLSSTSKNGFLLKYLYVRVKMEKYIKNKISYSLDCLGNVKTSRFKDRKYQREIINKFKEFDLKRNESRTFMEFIYM